MPRAALVTDRTPPLTRHRPVDAPTRTVRDPDSSSIAGRRASGFLQVSLSKVSRLPHRGARPDSSAETPPMNASDYPGPDCWRAKLLLRVRRPVLDERDRRGGVGQKRVGEESSVERNDVLLLGYARTTDRHGKAEPAFRLRTPDPFPPLAHPSASRLARRSRVPFRRRASAVLCRHS